MVDDWHLVIKAVKWQYQAEPYMYLRNKENPDGDAKSDAHAK